MYKELFKSIKIGTMEVKNRLVVPAMDSHYTDENHYFTKQALNYYGKRAQGGFGLIFTEFMCVSEEGLAEKTQAGIYDDCFIEQLTRLTQRVHDNGSKMIAQLQHSGRLQGKGTSNHQPVGASNIPAIGDNREIHELTKDEIKVIIQKFVDAALRAKKANFDGVEIHGAHGYLLAQFLSKGINKRVDEYGGNITNRARIVVEIIKAIKEACGKDYPVIVRTSGNEGYYGGNDIEDAVAQAILFKEAGADALNISYGVAIQSYYVKAGFNIDNVRRIKEVVSIPVIGVGRINDPTLALSIIKSGSADLIALGRQSICDPDFPNKVKDNLINEILTCTGCLQRCLYTQMFEDGFGTSCMINPFSGKEGLWNIEPTIIIKNIAIVGAGVAGLHAAWILAKRGHNVVVYEKDTVAGGQYRLASVPNMKHTLAKTISTYVAFCDKHGVKIQYNTLATKEMLDGFDEVIIASGAQPIVPPIRGIDQKNVVLANDVLAFKEIINGKKVAVLGAGLVGAETAEVLADYNNEVDIIDMIDQVAPLAPKRTRTKLIEHLNTFNVGYFLNRKVIQIKENSIEVENNEIIEELTGYDVFVLAFGSKSYRPIEMDRACYLGDALKVGDAKKAIYEATKLGLEL